MYRSPSAPMEKEKKIGEIDVTSLSPIFFEGRGHLSLGEHVLYLILFPTVKSALLLLFNIFTSCCWLDPLLGSGSPFFCKERREKTGNTSAVRRLGASIHPRDAFFPGLFFQQMFTILSSKKDDLTFIQPLALFFLRDGTLHFILCTSNVTRAIRNICSLSDELNATVLICFRDWSFCRAGLYFLEVSWPTTFYLHTVCHLVWSTRLLFTHLDELFLQHLYKHQIAYIDYHPIR